ncbi:LysR family transcriptional regulator [Mycolicibacterium tokaiense]|uniref:Probable hydrogen peroxide-inducible genes activator n=1 Tax=Mycolicibacterium tokaiense TaxID=39695 RepID=A0A378TED8_9MYCO|nr:LysR family transcriptional regulator [Mycolicibacterium tokaiense]BBY86334.1 LysR family transcriptional regulator [Mycolicibacterium tokaiense]STZ59158.1 LysR family regulatory protein [Mycolicibacterium tokaiense]
MRKIDAATDDLFFFEMVATSPSLTAAAREMGTSVSTVSKRLSHLEKRLGVQLIQRTTRRLTLTSEGERYARGVAAIADDLVALEDSLSERSELVGRIRVLSTVGLGRHHIAPLVAQFCILHPRLRVELDLSPLPMSNPDAPFDVAIRVGTLQDSRLRAKRLRRNRRIVCAAPEYIARAGTPATPADVRGHNCIVLRENDGRYAAWQFGSDDSITTVEVEGNLAATDGDVVTQWCCDGHGLMMRSLWHVAPLLRSGELVQVLADVPTPSADIMAVHSAAEHTPRRVDELIHFLAAQLGSRIDDQ